MVSLGSRLKRTSVLPIAPAPASPPASPHSKSFMSTYSAVPVRAPVARWSASTPPGTLQTFVASDEATDTEAADESLWYGTPVFDASHWHAKGGLALVRAMHAKLGATVEALIIQCAGDELGWPWECLALSWPNVNTVDISCDVSSVEADAQVLRWLGLVQDHVLFPLARLYRLTARWAGCTEVFEHPLRDDIDIELDKRLLLLRNLPSQICSSPQETCFYMYRAMFLVSVEFDMSTMAKTNSGALAMYTYISYLLKTDVFSPHSIGLTGAKPSHLQSILAKISENSHKLTYDRMRVSTGNLALQFSLKVLSLDLYCMTEGRHTIPFCAAHFPQLESLVINHSPDFKGGRDDPMNLGVLFRLPWPRLVDLQLPFISDDYARLLLDKCPNLRFLHVCPEPRYERWTAYAQTFTPKALHTIATQWHTLRQLVVSYAFRQGLQPSDLGTATASPSRLSFSGTRMSTFSSRASVIGSSLSPLSIETFASSGNSNSSGKPQMPGLQPCDSFPIRPPSNSLRVLHLPYLQLSFSAGLALLADAPQLQILEFSYFIKDTEPATPSIAATLRRRVAPSPALPLNAPFADPDVVYRIRSMRHQLQNLILREACTTRFISSSWIEIMNMFAQLEAVTFVANKQEDIAVAARLIQFCNRNNARFGVKVDDQSRSYQTCIDFANSWDKSGKLLWSSQ